VITRKGGKVITIPLAPRLVDLSGFQVSWSFPWVRSHSLPGSKR
jgi:hypothetical protein